MGVRAYQNEADIRSQLQLTPAESERLRHASYHKQTALGLRHSSRADPGIDKLEDSADMPPQDDSKVGFGSGIASEVCSEAGTQG